MSLSCYEKTATFLLKCKPKKDATVSISKLRLGYTTKLALVYAKPKFCKFSEAEITDWLILKTLYFSEGLIFGGAYLWREICVTSLGRLY